jgi:hypothetical protein
MQSGSELTITNSGKIILGSSDNLDIQLGAIFDNVYGEIVLDILLAHYKHGVKYFQAGCNLSRKKCYLYALLL